MFGILVSRVIPTENYGWRHFTLHDKERQKQPPGPVIASREDGCPATADFYTGIYTISQSAVEELGMTHRRWQWASALLETARIHDGRDVTAMDFDGAVRAVDAAIRHL